MVLNKRLFAVLAASFFAAVSWASDYPEIPSLNSRDTVFKQYQKQIEDANKAMFLGKDIGGYLYFYEYTAGEYDTLISVAARCAVRYDTLATLNGVDSSTPLDGVTLILPTVNGLFIPYEPETAIDILLAKQYSVECLAGDYPTYTIDGTDFYFILDGKFSPTERAYFLDPGLVMPLEESILTSSFGMRISPISGKWKMHNGIDMAAPTGSSIFAVKSGSVKYAITLDPTYGNYVILDHGGGMTSLYAHMSKMLVKTGDSVAAGQVIGRVGTTGLSTGPHLHFEIRLNGQAQDPQKYLQRL
ncbi:MAG TPA: M23 family peptidase [Treponema sp.]|jgi:murein DD-endopeptidase MepM/ murein hydrolase activator NlpD|nr:M23 family peptidase [Treponema sp.]